MANRPPTYSLVGSSISPSVAKLSSVQLRIPTLLKLLGAAIEHQALSIMPI